jgi:adenylate cyclase
VASETFQAVENHQIFKWQLPVFGYPTMRDSPETLARKVSLIMNSNEEIFSKEGTVDKYLGDSVMAVFGAPNSIDNHQEAAVEWAKKTLEKFVEFEKKWSVILNTDLLDIGMAMASGEVITGPIGTKNKFDFTVIGSTVNLASRLEDLNKRYQTRLCICDQTHDVVRVKEGFLDLEEIRVRGFNEDKQVYFFDQ